MSYSSNLKYYPSKPKTEIRKGKVQSNSNSQERKLYANQDIQFARPKQLKMKTQATTPVGELQNP